MPVLKNHKVDLKNKYERYLKISFILSLLVIIGAFKFSPKVTGKQKIITSKQGDIKIESIIQTKQPDKPPDKPKPIVPEISITNDIEDVVFTDVSINYNEDLSKPPDKNKERIVEEELRDFVVVEEMPVIIGGLQAIQSKLYYPEFPRRAGIEGRIIVAAVIDEEGNVLKVEILKSLFPQLDEIAMNAVKQTKFIPGKQRDKPVKVKVAIPIDFKLK